MEDQQQVALKLAKRLVPWELRLIEDKESWGEPVLTSSQFVIGLTVMTLSFLSGIFLYYSVLRFIPRSRTKYSYSLLLVLYHVYPLLCRDI